MLFRSPAPKQTVRVMVGRSEVITPEMERDVKNQVALLRSPSARVRAGAQANLTTRGRFYEPILRSILTSEKNSAVRKQIEKLIADAGKA